jgi:pilus assembly protein CpaE
VRATAEGAELTALLIAPDRSLAEAALAGLRQARVFQVIADLRSYPPLQTLQIRVRQCAPDVVLLDVATDFSRAAELIRTLARARPPVHVIGLHARNDPEALVGALRAGASEFLYAPFEASAQREAAARIRRLRQPEPAATRQPGKVFLFASVKPGSGASTLASQTAFALQRLTRQRVLLADLDVMSGTASFYVKAPASTALVELLVEGERLEPGRWVSLVEHVQGLEVLPAPAAPGLDSVEPGRFHEFCEYARRSYDFVLLDLPAIFHRLSLLGLAECDLGFLVSTMDLASLHLARKAVRMLGHLGLGPDRYQVLINRAGKGDGLRLSDMEKVIGCAARASFPEDEISIQRMWTMGQPLDASSELGGSIEEFAGRLAGVAPPDKKRTGLLLNALPVFSESS